MTTEKFTKIKIIDFVNDYSKFIGIGISFILALIFVYTTIWYLSVLAALVGGMFYKKMNQGALAGCIGVGLAWTIFVVIDAISSNVDVLIDQIGAIITGSSGFGWILILIVTLLGFVFGTLGGSLGSGIRILVEKEEK